MPKAIVAASNVPSSVGSASASPTTKPRPAAPRYRPCATPIIPGLRSTPRTRPNGATTRVEVGRDLAGAGRDVERGVARPEPGARHERRRQRGSWNAEISRFMRS